MAVKASAETIREMKNRLLRQSKTLNVLTRVFVAVFVRPALGMTQKQPSSICSCRKLQGLLHHPSKLSMQLFRNWKSSHKPLITTIRRELVDKTHY